MSNIRSLLAIGLLCLPTGACTAATFLSAMSSSANNVFLRQDVNLTEKNYAAADYLAGLTHATLNKHTPVIVGRLNHANLTGITSAFASVVPEQVGARLAQLGYNVKMPTDGLYGNAYESGAKRGVILTGTYLPGTPNVDVNLRLMNNQSGRVIGAFDYSIPVNNEIGGLLEQRPTTLRMQPTAVPGASQQPPAEPAMEDGQEDLPMKLLGPAP